MQEELSAGPSATLQLRLLGGFGLRSAGSPIPVVPTVQRLVAFVALRSRPVLRSFVAGSLWPDMSERRAGANLRAALWRLPDPDLLDSSRTELALHQTVEVDYRAALTSAREVIVGRAEGAGRPEDGLVLDLLPGWDDAWVVIERERLRQLRLHALESVCRALLADGETARAIDLALLVAHDEPHRESVQRILVAAHLAEGNQLEALRTYDDYRARIHRALGLQPSVDMEAMIRPLRAAAPA